MSDEVQGIPDEIVKLVRQCIDRPETLHVLLLLQSTRPRWWTVRDVTVERRSSRFSAETSLRTLAHHGLLVRQDEAYLFAPRTPDLVVRAAALAECHRIRPRAVIALILCGPCDRGPVDLQ